MSNKFDVMESVDAMCQMRLGWIADSYELKNKIAPFAKPIQALLRMCGDNVHASFWSSEIEIRIKISSMKEVEPLIESFQDIIGEEFDGSADETEYGKSRTFTMSKFPLKIIADVSEDEFASCKAVQVGEKIVPVYEIKCDD